MTLALRQQQSSRLMEPELGRWNRCRIAPTAALVCLVIKAMAMTQKFDAIVIGTGQSGPPLADRLTQEGFRTAIIERKHVGGTCVNTGCIPTKTLVASARVAHQARRAAEYGVKIGRQLRVDMKRVKARKDRISLQSRTGVTRWIKSLPNATFYRGHARFESPRTVRVNGELLEAERIFINVGARALVPEMPGIDEIDYLTNSSMMHVDFLPKHLVIIGGSYIGLEFGQMYRRFGSRVTVIEQRERLIGREDPDISDAIRKILEKEGIEIRLNAKCIAVQRKGKGRGRRPRLPQAAAARHRLAPLAGGGASAEHRRSRPRGGGRGHRRAWLYRGGRTVAHQCALHLGDRRLQWPRRLHPHFLQ